MSDSSLACRVQGSTDAMDCSPPGSSVHRILQARTVERVAVSFCRRSFKPRDRTQVSCTAGGFSAQILRPSEPPGKPRTLLHFPSSIPAIWPALRILFPTVTTFHSHLISGWSTIFFAITQMTPLISNFIHSHQQVQPPPLTFMLFVPNGASSIFPISASLRFSHSWLLSPFQLTFCGQTLQLCSHAQPRTSRLLWPTLEPAQSTTTPAHFQSPFSVLDFRLQWRLSQAFVDLTLALCNLGSNP